MGGGFQAVAHPSRPSWFLFRLLVPPSIAPERVLSDSAWKAPLNTGECSTLCPAAGIVHKSCVSRFGGSSAAEGRCYNFVCVIIDGDGQAVNADEQPVDAVGHLSFIFCRTLQPEIRQVLKTNKNEEEKLSKAIDDGGGVCHKRSGAVHQRFRCGGRTRKL